MLTHCVDDCRFLKRDGHRRAIVFRLPLGSLAKRNGPKNAKCAEFNDRAQTEVLKLSQLF